MKKLALITGILIIIPIAVAVTFYKPIQPVGEVTNPKDVDYIAPIDVNGIPVIYAYTDENIGEDLIIATTQPGYSSWDSVYVEFAIKNISASNQNVKVQFLYDGGASTSEIEELTFDAPYQVTVDDYGKKDYLCKTNWVATTTSNFIGEFTNYQCGKEQIRSCDSVVGKTCTVNNDLVGTHQETRYKDVYVPIAKSTVEDLKSIQTKPIDSKFITKEQVTSLIKAGETKYYRAKLVFTPRSGGEFYITANGDLGGKGILK